MRTFSDCRFVFSICSFSPLVALLQIIRSTIADDFQPTVTWFCPNGGFDLTLRTTQPFFGAIHSMDRYQSCRINGTGKIETRYRIPFTSTKECNVKYSQVDDVYSVRIEVNEHPVLILQQDRIFDLVCEGKKSSVSNTSSQPQTTTRESQVFDQFNSHVSFELGVADADRMLNDVVYGKPYFLRVEMRRHDTLAVTTWDAFKVAACRVLGATNATVELTDSSGCSTDRNLISDFVYEQGRAIAKIPSMFSFPSSNTVRFECSVILCNHETECSASCARRNDPPLYDDGFTEAQMITELLSENSPDDTEVLDERKHLAMTTVTVSKSTQSQSIPGNVDDASFFASSTCVSPSDLLLLYKLCAVLCVMFLVGCCINIIFCIYISTSGPRNKQKREVATKKASFRDAPHTSNDFWIKDNSSPSARADGPLQNGSAADSYVYDQNRRLSLASYASVRQKSHRCLGQLPAQFNGDPSDTPSPKSPTSLRPSTFGSRPFMTNSTTIETDLNSPHSSVITERNTTDFSRSDEFPLPPQMESSIYSNIRQNERESYSIL